MVLAVVSTIACFPCCFPDYSTFSKLFPFLFEFPSGTRILLLRAFPLIYRFAVISLLALIKFYFNIFGIDTTIIILFSSSYYVTILRLALFLLQINQIIPQLLASSNVEACVRPRPPPALLPAPVILPLGLLPATLCLGAPVDPLNKLVRGTPDCSVPQRPLPQFTCCLLIFDCL